MLSSCLREMEVILKLLLFIVVIGYSNDFPENHSFNKVFTDYVEKEVSHLYVTGISNPQVRPEVKRVYMVFKDYVENEILSNVENSIFLSEGKRGKKDVSFYYKVKARKLLYIDIIFRTMNYYISSGKDPMPLLGLINNLMLKNNKGMNDMNKTKNLGNLVISLAHEVSRLPDEGKKTFIAHYSKIIDSIKVKIYRKQFMTQIIKFVEIISKERFITEEEKEKIAYKSFMETICEGQSLSMNNLLSEESLLGFSVDLKNSSDLSFVNPF